jgi:hypothetical protein
MSSANLQTFIDCLTADRQGQGEATFTLTPSIIPDSNYIVMVSD